MIGDVLPIMADFSQLGSSDEYGRMVIDTRDMALQSSSRRASLVMVVYDSLTRADMESGSYAITMQIHRDTPFGPQTALILAAESETIREVVLRLASVPEEPVAWRALGATFDGRFRSYPKIIWHDEDILVAPTALDEVVAALFAAPYVPEVPEAPVPEDPEDPTLPPVEEIDPPPTSPLTEINGFELIQDPRIFQQIAGYWWDSDHTFVLQGGAWWMASADIAWQPPVPDVAPACCDCGDVFLIRDPTLALSWDQEGSSALIDNRTIVFNHTEQDGTRWILTEMEGWWNLPDANLPSLDRSGYVDGAFPVDGRYEVRSITIEGLVIPGPHVGVAVPRGRIIRTADAVREGALLVAKEPGHPKQSYVWLTDRPDIITSDTTGRTEFTIALRAVDPVKYHAGQGGLTSTDLPIDVVLAGRVYIPPEELRFWPVPARQYQGEVQNTVVVATNYGNTKVSPRIFMYGPMTNPTIQNITTNQIMTYQGTISPQDVLITDCYWRTVVLRRASTVTPEEMSRPYEIAGDNRRYMLTLTSPWIDIMPGDNQMRATSAVADGRCAVVFRSGWIGS